MQKKVNSVLLLHFACYPPKGTDAHGQCPRTTVGRRQRHTLTLGVSRLGRIDYGGLGLVVLPGIERYRQRRPQFCRDGSMVGKVRTRRVVTKRHEWETRGGVVDDPLVVEGRTARENHHLAAAVGMATDGKRRKEHVVASG